MRSRAQASGRAPTTGRAAAVARAPAVGFVSLGCPKALVDSERLITELKSRGYAIAAGYADADLVVVNTCGFIDAAIDESLQAIGEALRHNGRVLVTGCLGANPQRILERHPKVLGVTGPHAYERVIAAVNQHLPQPHRIPHQVQRHVRRNEVKALQLLRADLRGEQAGGGSGGGEAAESA